MQTFIKFLTKLKGFWKLYQNYGYEGETVEFIIETLRKSSVQSNKDHELSDISLCRCGKGD